MHEGLHLDQHEWLAANGLEADDITLERMAYEQSTMTLALLQANFGLGVGGSKYEDVALAGAYFALSGDKELVGITDDGRSLSLSDLLGKKNTEKLAKMFFEYYCPKVEKWQKWAKEGKIENFTEQEKNELKLFYTLLAIGGKFGLGYPEAGDLLLNYLKGEKAKGLEGTPPYLISPEPYKNSVIVQDAMSRMKQFILKDLQDGVLDRKSWSSKNLLFPMKGRDVNKLGNFKREGYLASEQTANPRLKFMNNIFPLYVNVRVLDKNTVELEWIVEDEYIFKSYREDPTVYTDLPVGNYTFRLDDGLSQFLEELGIAKRFWYKASWKEVWKWK
ncbi:hypothetical protein [Thermospira aquatica]|uniref:Uncharacterized protein n=1 Tax=Thermospira aquatica TaxID=2828656 RepID=A0AAX3BB58_9SPIR|nr:hypothetical protein [Thermospira aquatica]URA09409.1 hypothetical protein KDW03_07895 [Thermospira aquatica]